MSSSGWGKDWICLVALLSQVGLVDLLAHAYIFAIFLCLFCVFLKMELVQKRGEVLLKAGQVYL